MSGATNENWRTGRGEPVFYFDRASGEIREEAIYGEKPVRFAYENALGRLALDSVVSRAFFSRLYGWLMDRPGSRKKIAPFIARYGLDPGEFAAPAESFGSFNEFFVRHLKPEARPVDEAENVAVFPADGRHLGFPDLSDLPGIYAKGQRLSLVELLGDPELADRYARGALVISRLCPVDYHRFHFCAAGVPGEPELINGPLFSVSPIALRRRIEILAENKRVLTRFQSDRFGEILILEIGATNVGSIIQTAEPGTPVAKGAEKGYFAFGGSMTMLLFEPDRIELAGDLVEQSRQGRELYARMGERLGIER
ncbi:MAG: phosphatidylserine decarboxylase [Verrucomicrobiae bacterium]|nr:phosphatidylserine decarboxylase [Verrucomicrobiae bacterium]